MTPSSQFQSPYLVTSRTFPVNNPGDLAVTLSKSYVDIANNVNISTQGTYERVQVATRNKYYNDVTPQNQRQSLRQVYTLAALPNTGTSTIATGINFTDTTQFVNIYGTAEDASVAVPLTPWVMTPADDAPYVRVNKTSGNIEIITTSGNWTGYSAMIVLEYILI